MNLKNYIPWEQDQLDESLKLKKKLENPIFWNRASINLPWEWTKAWRIFEIVLKEFRRRQSGVSDFSFLRRGLEEPYEVKYQTFSKFLFSEGAKSGYFSFSQLFFHLPKILFFILFSGIEYHKPHAAFPIWNSELLTPSEEFLMKEFNH